MSLDQAIVFACDFSQPSNFSVALADVDPRFEHFSVFVKPYFREVYIRIECIPSTHDQEKM